METKLNGNLVPKITPPWSFGGRRGSEGGAQKETGN